MESNYDRQVYIARELFLKYDQKMMIQKFQLEYDADWLYLVFLNRQYRIGRSTGEIAYRDLSAENSKASDREKREVFRKNTEYEQCLDYQIVMTICDVLCCSGTMPVLAHEWCPVYALQVTMSSPNTDTFTGQFAKLFSGRKDELLAACKRLGGEQPQIKAGADVCWQFSVFPFFPVQMRFWDGDDEFEPKIQLLWDRNTLDFMHFETTYYLQGHLMERLKALAGL